MDGGLHGGTPHRPSVQLGEVTCREDAGFFITEA